MVKKYKNVKKKKFDKQKSKKTNHNVLSNNNKINITINSEKSKQKRRKSSTKIIKPNGSSHVINNIMPAPIYPNYSNYSNYNPILNENMPLPPPPRQPPEQIRIHNSHYEYPDDSLNSFVTNSTNNSNYLNSIHNEELTDEDKSIIL